MRYLLTWVIVVSFFSCKPYTSNDTLFYRITASNFAPPYIMNAPYKVGPFTNGQILDTIVKSSIMGYDNGSQSIKVQIYNEWRLGSRYHDPKRLNQQRYSINPCQVYEEAVIDLGKAIK